jgi:hypothetical protein
MAREPVLWCAAAKSQRTIPARRWNPETQQMESVIDIETGLPVIEKIPQRPHDGDSPPDKPTFANLRRWIHVLRHDGHVVRMPINMAAADVEGLDFVGRERRAKARHYGWIPVGMCPLALLAAGDLRPQQLAMLGVAEPETIERKARELRVEACDPRKCGEVSPCPHYLQEEKARKERQNRRQAKINAAFQSEADKLLKGQQQQTSEIVAGVSKVMAETFAGAGGMSLSPEQLADLVGKAVAAAMAAQQTQAKGAGKEK